ncbi:hypothetical protein [Mycolicibacterium gadium]|uniref:ESX-1 secretion-associated protein n=1 Tax=Mycolicibacterium gadium TaxID=1794 RepID=A0A7I7WP00_MYCGU|nr:hypothetical protein [Mycolicibacterium gadium]BBZ18253.1 hypothetical protein MGAD_25880 [Mycolicibacterium gadium]
MFADTDAIRALGSANSVHADDLADVAATLSSLPIAASGSSLGPVGAGFLSALTEAVADGSRAAAALSERLWASDAAAYAVASAYDSADSAAGTRIAGA